MVKKGVRMQTCIKTQGFRLEKWIKAEVQPVTPHPLPRKGQKIPSGHRSEKASSTLHLPKLLAVARVPEPICINSFLTTMDPYG